MTQVTWRASDQLVEDVRRAAAAEGRSMNDFITHTLSVRVDPDTAGDAAAQTRERLARAGLLAPIGKPRRRPDPALVSEARRAAGRGRPLSDIVSEQRG